MFCAFRSLRLQHDHHGTLSALGRSEGYSFQSNTSGRAHVYIEKRSST